VFNGICLYVKCAEKLMLVLMLNMTRVKEKIIVVNLLKFSAMGHLGILGDIRALVFL
jgi:hypothetical protein